MIDLRTVYLSYFITCIVSFILLLKLQRQVRTKFSGLLFLTLDFLFQCICSLLVFLRGYIPNFFSMDVALTISAAGILFGLIGIERFVSINRKHSSNIILIVLFFFVQYYFTFHRDSLEFRTLNFLLVSLILFIQCLWALYINIPRQFRSLTKNVGFVFVGFCVLTIVRIVKNRIVGNETVEYLNSGNFEAFSTLTYLSLSILMVFFTVLMVNERLLKEVEIQEDKFSKAFYSAPYAIMITRVSDGKIIEVNKGFEKITHYKQQEVIGKTSTELNFWGDNKYRAMLLNEMESKGYVDEMEFQFSGQLEESFYGQISCTNIVVNDEKCLLSVINDITERKKTEVEIRKSREILKTLLVNLQMEHNEQKMDIATQIDNRLNQTLTALRMNIGILKKKLSKIDNPQSKELYVLSDTAYDIIGTTIETSMKLMGELRNEVLHLLGFLDAMKLYIDEFQKNSNVICKFECQVEQIQLSKIQSISLFKIFQDIMECILNLKSQGELNIYLSERQNLLILLFEENGIQFFDNVVLQDENNFIPLIQERAKLLNGDLRISKSQDVSTSIILEIPLLLN